MGTRRDEAVWMDNESGSSCHPFPAVSRRTTSVIEPQYSDDTVPEFAVREDAAWRRGQYLAGLYFFHTIFTV
jgi:hypothetical protein